MHDIDDLLKDTLESRAQSQLPDPQLVGAITHRIRRENAVRVTGILGTAAAGVGVATWAASLALGAHDTGIQPAGSPSAAAATPLVTTGECAGLTVLVGDPNPGAGTTRPPLHPLALQQGTNAVTMAERGYLWLQAEGPCSDRLVVNTPGTLVHAMADSTSNRFGPIDRNTPDPTVATVFTNATAGTDQISVSLDEPCGSGACDPLASITVTISGAPDYGDDVGVEPTTVPGP